MRGLKALFITKIYRIARMDENKKRLIINGNKCTKDSMAIKKNFLRFVKEVVLAKVVLFWTKCCRIHFAFYVNVDRPKQ